MKHCEQFIFLSIDRLNQNKNREFCHAMLIYGKYAQMGFWTSHYSVTANEVSQIPSA